MPQPRVVGLLLLLLLVPIGIPAASAQQAPALERVQQTLEELREALALLQERVDGLSEALAGLAGQSGATDAVAPAAAAAPAPPQAARLLPADADPPPLSWTCPMHPEIHEQHEGICPLCQMDLVEARRVEGWTCPVHSVVVEAAPGSCPIGGRALVPIRFDVTWSCPRHPEVSALAPGVCPLDGRDPLVAKFALLPHEDHNPKHGGIFFMAPDSWHHLEGTYPEAGRFVVFLYDNYSQPMSARGVKGRAVLSETYDPSTRQVLELAAYPLLPSSDGAYLEAYVGSQDFPTEIAAKIQFTPGGPEERFDFIFAAPTVDEPATAAATPAPRPVTAEPAVPAPSAPAPTAVARLINPVIPESAAGIAQELIARDGRIRDLIEGGGFTEVYVPALEAKDLALALEPHIPDLATAADQVAVRLAVKGVVRASYLLDWYGDLGNAERVNEAYDLFATSVGTITSSWPEP